jgi:hypothetical protein
MKHRLFLAVLIIAIMLAMLGFRMGRAEAHLAEPREVTMPTQRARVSTRASLPNTLLVRSSSRHLGFPSPLMQGTHAPTSVRLTAPLPDANVGYGLTLFREPDHMHQWRISRRGARSAFQRGLHRVPKMAAQYIDLPIVMLRLHRKGCLPSLTKGM